MGETVTLADGTEIVDLGNGITIGARWAYGDLDPDPLVDTAEAREGVPCVALEHIIAYKREANPRDVEHLAIIEARS